MNDVDAPSEKSLNLLFPLPYRVFGLFGLGILAWATNLHGLDKLGVDTVSALDLRTEGVHARGPLISHRSAGYNQVIAANLYTSAYRVFIGYTVIWFFSWTTYRLATYGDATLVDAYGYIPGVTALWILALLICPYNIFWKLERNKFTQAARRCFFSSSTSPVCFSDVVFADIGTSFAKVLGDVWLSLCMLLPGNTLLAPPLQEGWMRWVLPTIMSLPYIARFRQCIIEYNHPDNESRRPLFNAIKYATAFPVIFLSAAQRLVVEDLRREKGDVIFQESWHGEHQLFRLWLLVAVVNSIYSFWWDVTNDWGLDLLKLESPSKVAQEKRPPRRLVLPHLHSGTPLVRRDSQETLVEEPLRIPPLEDPPTHRRTHPFGLRPVLLFPLTVYPLLIFLNLILRMTWSIKLSTHLHTTSDGSVASLWLEVAELIRRWLWVFLRVE